MTLAHLGVSLVVAGKDGGDGTEHRPSWAVLITGGSCCSVLQSLGSNAIELHGGEFQPGPKCLWRNGFRTKCLGRHASPVASGVGAAGPIVVRNSSGSTN